MSEISHSIVLNNKTDVEVTGIKSVDTFDDGVIIATTLDDCYLTIEGYGLSIKDVNLDRGIFSASGNVISFYYSEQHEQRRGFFGRIFKNR